MGQNIRITYVTDWKTDSDDTSEQDPFLDIIASLDCRLSLRTELPRLFSDIDLLILHPRSMRPEIFKTIRVSKEENPSIKTIVISSAHGSDLFLQAIDVGVDKYLLKPLSASAVKTVAERLIQQSTEAKEAQKAIDHIQLMYTAISKTSLSARLDGKGAVWEINDLLVNLIGSPVEKIIGTHWFRFVEPRFHVFLRSLVRERLKAGEIYRGIIEFIDTRRGSVMVDTTLYAILNPEGEIDEIVFIGHDLSDVNRAILSSMEQLIDHDTSLAVLFNYRCEAIAVNRKFVQLGGYRDSEEFFAAEGTYEWLREENGALVPILNRNEPPRKSLEKIFARLRTENIEGQIVLRREGEDERYYTLHTTSMPNPMLPDDEYHILYFVDVTDFERLKEEKLSDAKLMTVGRLAAAITHEINTPITYIKGNLELLKLEAEDRIPDAQTLFQPIEEGIGRIQSIVGSMYEFAGTGKEEMRPCNVHMTLVYALRIAINRAKHIVPITINGEVFTYETSYDPYSCKTMGISARLEQVWIIIINNALDEFEKGTIPYEDRRLDIRLQCNPRHITVKITDNAGGIPEAIVDKIFDFAVGGEKKKSMGIGLNVAKAIIDKHGAQIRVSNENQGAAFEIVLKTYEEKE